MGATHVQNTGSAILAKTQPRILKWSLGKEIIVLALLQKVRFRSYTPKGHLYLVTPSFHLTVICYPSTHTDCSIVCV